MTAKIHSLGIVGRKAGMSRVFTEDGKSVPVTLIEATPNRITQIKTVETDGYSAVQVTAGVKRASLLTKPEAGHLAKAKVEAGRGLWELRVADDKIAVIQVSGTIMPPFTGRILKAIERAGTETLVEGRWFTETEVEYKKDVCLIGATVKETFFPFESPIGQTLEINGRPFTIIGHLEKKEQLLGGGGGNNDESNTIYLPFHAALRIKPNADDIFILAVAREGRINEARDQIEDLLRVRRNVKYGQKNNFSTATADSIIEQFQSITAGVALAMVVISSIGLLIGGIGVMNIMLVSVTERTREIGIRKAIGAKQSDILVQFLIEAGTLTGFGGLVGLLIGWGFTLLINIVFPSYVPIWAPFAGFFASVGIGLIFGLFPAWKAARLDPIESLRYE